MDIATHLLPTLKNQLDEFPTAPDELKAVSDRLYAKIFEQVDKGVVPERRYQKVLYALRLDIGNPVQLQIALPNALFLGTKLLGDDQLIAETRKHLTKSAMVAYEAEYELPKGTLTPASVEQTVKYCEEMIDAYMTATPDRRMKTVAEGHGKVADEATLEESYQTSHQKRLLEKREAAAKWPNLSK